MGEIIIDPKFNINEIYNEVIFLNPYRFGVAAPIGEPNVFIGGVGVSGGPYDTPAKFSAFMVGITVDDIQNFTVDSDNNVSFYIGKEYQWTGGAYPFRNSTTLRYYRDMGMCTNLGRAFYMDSETTYCSFIYAKNATATALGVGYRLLNNIAIVLPSLTNAANNFIQWSSARVVAIPKCVQLGSTVSANDYVFNNITTGGTIYANPILETCNSGGLDWDLNYAKTSRGFTVKYALDFTPPNKVTDLSSSAKTTTTVTLNWTAPSSLNGVDKYIVLCSGIAKTVVTTLTYTVTGLISGKTYEFEIMVIDVYGNPSDFSDKLIITTL